MIPSAALLAIAGILLIAGGGGTGSHKTSERLQRLGPTEGEGEEKVGRFGENLWQAFLLTPYRLLPQPLRETASAGIPACRWAPEKTRTDLLAGARIWASSGLPLAIVLIMRFSPAAFALATVAALSGLFVPEILLKREADGFEKEILEALPQFTDMLFAQVLGGKNLDQGFRAAARMAKEPLASLLCQTAKEVDLGASRSEAFEKVADRCNVRELSSLLRSIVEAERRGHELTTTLEIFSREIRARRRDQLRATVARTPVRILFPLVFLVLPSSVLLTVGPTFMATVGNIM